MDPIWEHSVSRGHEGMQTSTRCVLHIGTHKTGTTTLQKVLVLHEDQITEQGWKLSSVAPPSTGVLMRYAADDTRKFRYRTQHGEDDPGRLKAFRARFEEDVAELAKEPGSAALFVDEAAELLESQEIERLLTPLRISFQEIVVVLYVRPQVDLAVSLYSQHLRSGQATDTIIPDNWRDRDHPRFNYLTKARHWSEALSRKGDRFILRPFNRKTMKNGDVVDDFLSLIGVRLEDRIEIAPMNVSLSIAGQSLLRSFNRYMLRNNTENPDAIRSEMLRILETLPNARGMGRRPSKEDAVSFMRIFEKDNAELGRVFFEKDPGFLRFDATRFPEIEDPEIEPPAELFLELLTKALQEMQAGCP